MYNNNQKTKFGIFENCPAGYSRCSEDKNETPCWKNDCEFCRCSSLVKNCSSQCVSSNFTIFMDDCIAKMKVKTQKVFNIPTYKVKTDAEKKISNAVVRH